MTIKKLGKSGNSNNKRNEIYTDVLDPTKICNFMQVVSNSDNLLTVFLLQHTFSATLSTAKHLSICCIPTVYQEDRKTFVQLVVSSKCGLSCCTLRIPASSVCGGSCAIVPLCSTFIFRGSFSLFSASFFFLALCFHLIFSRAIFLFYSTALVAS